MVTKTNTNGFFKRLGEAWNALLKSDREFDSVANLSDGLNSVEIISKVVSLEMDIEERDKKIETMRKEFSLLRSQVQKDNKDYHSETLEKLFKRIAPYLSQSATMRAMHEEKREIKAEDLFKLLGNFEKIFEKEGLMRIGEVGNCTPYQNKFHQRLSGSMVSDGNVVIVRFVGYLFHETVIRKAMVNKKDS